MVGDEQYGQAAMFLRVLVAVLLLLILIIMFVELIALVETFILNRNKRRDVFERQAGNFQILLFGISLANAFMLCCFLLDATRKYDYAVPCSALTKMMGVGYVVSFQLAYVFFIMRARIAGRMHNTKCYRWFRRVIELVVVLFLPCLLLPLFLVAPESAVRDSDPRCLLKLPLHLLIVFFFGNAIISCSVIILFLYPLLATARETDGVNNRTSRMFVTVARFNARLSIFALLSTSVAVIIFCVLDYLALQNREQDYLVLVAHGISLIDIIGLGICIRLSLRVWIPSFCRRKLDTFSRSSSRLLRRASSSNVRFASTSSLLAAPSFRLCACCRRKHDYVREAAMMETSPVTREEQAAPCPREPAVLSSAQESDSPPLKSKSEAVFHRPRSLRLPPALPRSPEQLLPMSSPTDGFAVMSSMSSAVTSGTDDLPSPVNSLVSPLASTPGTARSSETVKTRPTSQDLAMV